MDASSCDKCHHIRCLCPKDTEIRRQRALPTYQKTSISSDSIVIPATSDIDGDGICAGCKNHIMNCACASLAKAREKSVERGLAVNKKPAKQGSSRIAKARETWGKEEPVYFMGPETPEPPATAIAGERQWVIVMEAKDFPDTDKPTFLAQQEGVYGQYTHVLKRAMVFPGFGEAEAYGDRRFSDRCGYEVRSTISLEAEAAEALKISTEKGGKMTVKIPGPLEAPPPGPEEERQTRIVIEIDDTWYEINPNDVKRRTFLEDGTLVLHLNEPKAEHDDLGDALDSIEESLRKR